VWVSVVQYTVLIALPLTCVVLLVGSPVSEQLWHALIGLEPVDVRAMAGFALLTGGATVGILCARDRPSSPAQWAARTGVLLLGAAQLLWVMLHSVLLGVTFSGCLVAAARTSAMRAAVLERRVRRASRVGPPT
jgi:hypothetical protein